MYYSSIVDYELKLQLHHGISMIFLPLWYKYTYIFLFKVHYTILNYYSFITIYDVIDCSSSCSATIFWVKVHNINNKFLTIINQTAIGRKSISDNVLTVQYLIKCFYKHWLILYSLKNDPYFPYFIRIF